MTRLFFLATLFTVSGCSEWELLGTEDQPDAPAPNIVVSPPMLQFSMLSHGETEVQSFAITNDGGSTLHVSGFAVPTGPLAFVILNTDTEFAVEVGETVNVDVRYSPISTLDFGQALVFSDDPDTPEAPVDLAGEGAVPELEITPSFHDFGEAAVPCGDYVDLTLASVGHEPLTITDFDYVSGGLLTLEADTLAALLPLTLAPGDTASVRVRFGAVDLGNDTGEFEVSSNDPRGIVQADQTAEGVYSATVVEAFTEPGIPPVDVMFLVDQSCSMEQDNIDDITNGIPGFINELQNVADWQLIEITAVSGCANGGLLDGTVGNADQLLIQNAFGWGHHIYTEALLELASVALAQTGPGGCNAGFLRPGAMLHIIVASDEYEQSGVNWATWLADYQGYVADPALVKVSSVTDINHSCGDGTGPGGYQEITNATGGVGLNICNANWGAQLTDIASEVLAGIRTYNLSDPAIEDTIEVRVDGVLTTDWTFANDSVTVNSPAIGEGDLVEVTYGVLADCP